MNLYVVSDLHIRGADDPYYRSLLDLISVRARPKDVIVLAGDVFDLFVGNKQVFLHQYSDFIRTLRSSGTQGVKIHYIEGNHDFLIEKAFSNIPGVTVHSTAVSLDLAGRKFYIAHGDTIDRKDFGYLLLRRCLRSPVVKGLIKTLPGEWIQKIGKTSSEQSRKRNGSSAKPKLLSNLENLRRTYRSSAAEILATGYDYVVFGHCHDLDEMNFQIDGKLAQYVNVGFPRVHGSFLSWSPGDPKIQRERLP